MLIPNIWLRADETGKAKTLMKLEIKKINETSGFNRYVQSQNEISYDHAKQKWGEEKFDAVKFKDAPLKQKAAMAVFLLNHRNIFVGKTLKELKQQLGPHDGFFWRDHLPAYLIEDGLSTNTKSWQIVFFVNFMNSEQKIEDLGIYENN